MCSEPPRQYLWHQDAFYSDTVVRRAATAEYGRFDCGPQSAAMTQFMAQRETLRRSISNSDSPRWTTARKSTEHRTMQTLSRWLGEMATVWKYKLRELQFDGVGDGLRMDAISQQSCPGKQGLSHSDQRSMIQNSAMIFSVGSHFVLSNLENVQLFHF